MSKLIIWGAGGHGKVIAEIARSLGRYGQILFTDDDARRAGTAVLGLPVVEWRSLADDAELVIAVGDNRARAGIYDRLQSRGARFATLVHPLAAVSPSARIGAGTVLMAFAAVNAEARIGDNCIVNTGAIVEHDCVVEDHAHLSPGSRIGGNVRIGRGAHLGIGAVVLPGKRVGARSTVGAGAVVVRDVPSEVTSAGVPARILSKVEYHAYPSV